VDLNGDPIFSLADHYFVKKVPSASFRGASKERFAFFADLVKQFRVDGVVWYSLLFRETYDIEGYLFSRASEFSDLPKLMVKSNYDAGETGGLQTRIETFMAIIEGG